MDCKTALQGYRRNPWHRHRMLKDGNLIAHFITCKRNGHHLLSKESARTCPTCGLYTHRWEDMGDIKKKIDKDVSATNDGFTIVSEKFKNIVEDVGVRDVNFFSRSLMDLMFSGRGVLSFLM